MNWKDIKGFEGYYQVSDTGKVRSLDRILKFNGTNSTRKGIILKNVKNKSGYDIVILTKKGKGKIYSVHRLVADAFIPNPLNKAVVNHKNSIRNDNNVQNLEWLTYKENYNHAKDKGRIKYKLGELSNNAKITNKIAFQIKELAQKSNLKNKEIADMFGVNFRTVSNIKLGKSWK